MREVPLDLDALDDQAKAAQAKLRGVIDEVMQPPLSGAAKTEVDAFGNPVER